MCEGEGLRWVTCRLRLIPSTRPHLCTSPLDHKLYGVVHGFWPAAALRLLTRVGVADGLQELVRALRHSIHQDPWNARVIWCSLRHLHLCRHALRPRSTISDGRTIQACKLGTLTRRLLCVVHLHTVEVWPIHIPIR